jgi:hypothetical protein
VATDRRPDGLVPPSITRGASLGAPSARARPRPLACRGGPATGSDPGLSLDGGRCEFCEFFRSRSGRASIPLGILGRERYNASEPEVVVRE